MKKRKQIRLKKWVKVFFSFIVISFVSALLFLLFNQEHLKPKKTDNKTVEETISYHDYYHEYVKTKEEKKIYRLEKGKMQEIGAVSPLVSLHLVTDSYESDGYFKIKDFDYYIDYRDLEKSESVSFSSSWKNYIPFNQSVKTVNKTILSLDGNVIYKIDEGMELPLLILEDDAYGVLFKDQLFYINKNDGELIKVNNTNLSHTTGIAALVYHFVYDSSDPEEKKACLKSNSAICLSDTQFRNHLEYLKENQFYTATMEDIELFIDGKIQLPKNTVLITIDDGYFTKASFKALEDYEMHATLFLIGSAGDPKDYESSSIELHSHTYKMHYTGACSGGQGSPLKCLEKEKLLADLKKSREQLNNTTIFCYPFFEYNDYAISVLKEAGFKMAFIGGRKKIKVGTNKYLIPRYGIVNTTNVSDLKKIVN